MTGLCCILLEPTYATLMHPAYTLWLLLVIFIVYASQKILQSWMRLSSDCVTNYFRFSLLKYLD